MHGNFSNDSILMHWCKSPQTADD